ncbi:hypothetical protein [Asticcacaulis sp. AC402]|nr:hypothetical protein [Asticcacaulis sp. AC402]
MTDGEAKAALSDPHYTDNHDRFMELRNRLVLISGAYHATKGIEDG